MADKTMWKLHYGGKEFFTEDGRLVDDAKGQTETGYIQFRLADDRWLKILTGPGIPMALEEVSPTVPKRVTSF